ncbi:TIR domain-containing protein [Kordia sp. TARA_039_SRF]|nr:TIR domain-containing protein [Kordia sp. TARA_039_SRF]
MSKPQEILELEAVYGITLEETKYAGDITIWNKSNLYFLNEKQEIIGLNLNDNQISKIENLEKLTNLSVLNISDNQISKIENLENLTNLSELVIIDNQISKIENLENLTNLSVLNISYNQISKIENLENLMNLSELVIAKNEISKIENLEKLTNLSELLLSYNQISKIENLERLTNLSSLDISDNQIADINSLKFASELPKLKYLDVYNNPFVATENLILEEYENHLDIIKSELQKLAEKQINVQLPVKVMLLGNHASGKSTLLTYIQTQQRSKVDSDKNNSTHVLSVVHSKKEINHNLPKAIFYDFGGQDYYHGIYRAFFTQETVNLLVWHPKSNENKLLDKDTNKFATRNYKRGYWLAQLRYAFDKENRNVAEKKVYDDPVLLIQTRADEQQNKQNWQEAFLQHNIVDEFHISLNIDYENVKNDAALHYLTATFWETIEKNTKERKEPAWYPEFLHYILHKKNSKAISLKTIIKYYKREVTDGFSQQDKKNALRADLHQLYLKGMLLYYNKDEKLNDVAWLNPAATVEKIHETILNKEKIKDYKGILTPKEFEDLGIDPKIERLLINEKVLFFDKGNNEYIIPNYLPLTSEDDKTFNLLKFDFSTPTFVLKFERFIPFGFINQLICHYGQNPDKKQYWRDQLVFTLDEKFKVWIQLDFSKLTTKVYIKSKKAKDPELNLVIQQIFREMLFLYWDEKGCLINSKEIENILENPNKDYMNEPHKRNFLGFVLNNFTSREVDINSTAKINMEEIVIKKLHIAFIKKGFETLPKPKGLFISTDNEYFVNYKKLDNPKTKETIPAYTLTKDGNDIDETSVRTQSSYRYQNFTDNPNIQKMKKIFISYSRKDVEYKDELRKHLNMLKLFDVADNWSCEDITIGKWHDQIQKELYESDLVIFMLSINFFNSRYIIEDEVLKTMNDIANGSNKKVYCIIVSEFPSLDAFDNKQLNDKQKDILKLGDYQFGMYAQELNKVTGQKEERIISLKEASRLGILDAQLTKIAEKILKDI